MDKYTIFKKLQTEDAVYINDENENCVLKFFVGSDGETVKGMLKPKGKDPYLVDITAPSIFDIMCESNEITKEEYEQYE